MRKSTVVVKNASMRKEKPSILWGLMTPQAVKNKQADIDLALQREYNTRKKTVARMKKTHEQVRKHNIEYNKKLLLEREQKEADKVAWLKARGKEKRKAYSALMGRTSYSKAAKVRYKTRSKNSSKGNKKPSRLFNDPNK